MRVGLGVSDVASYENERLIRPFGKRRPQSAQGSLTGPWGKGMQRSPTFSAKAVSPNETEERRPPGSGHLCFFVSGAWARSGSSIKARPGVMLSPPDIPAWKDVDIQAPKPL